MKKKKEHSINHLLYKSLKETSCLNNKLYLNNLAVSYFLFFNNNINISNY